MKSKILFVVLIVAIALSVFFTYERSFVWKNFELTNSEEELEEGVLQDDAKIPEYPVPEESMETNMDCAGEDCI